MDPRTSDSPDSNTSPATDDFASQAAAGGQGMAWELWYFLRTNKRWWLAPLLVLLLVLAAVIVLGGSGAAPFIYTLF
jgi:hypothetical protein